MADETLQVPLDRAKFQQYRNWNIATTCVGLILWLLFCVSSLFILHVMFASPAVQGTWAFTLFLDVCLVVFLGLATIPSWLLAHTQSETLRQNLPALIIDQDGIQDNSSNYIFGRIPWSEIESVKAESRYAPNTGETFSGIAIVVTNEDTLLRKKPKILSIWIRMDTEVSQKHQVFIPQGRVTIPVENAVCSANKFRLEYKALTMPFDPVAPLSRNGFTP